ncbi:hypothetical protein V1264_007186 [Littorina saxatilis]|uniref:Uncharacterized protein n=1 Tax=Littorina saxatilis TaxID=31220 RepID=A0AAN9AUJ0_9CAEN
MALVHPHSVECTKTELDIFGVPPTQTALEKGQWIEHHPIATLTDTGPIEFQVSGSGDDYLDLANTFLYVSAAIKHADGTNLADDEEAGPVNLWLHSLFSQLDVSLNNVLISSSTHNYAYRAFLETLLSYGPAAKNAFLTSSLWYKDTPGHMEKADVTNNTGYAARIQRTKKSRVVYMMGRLHSDLFFQDRYLINNVDLRLRLTRSKDAFSLLVKDAAGTKDYKVEVKGAILFCRKVSVRASIQVAHIKALEKGTAKYPIRRIQTKVFSVSRGTLVVNQENLFLGSLPRRLVVGCVSNAAYNGDQQLNPFHFNHFDINFLALYVDGKQVPAKPLQPNFEKGDHVRSYLTLYNGTGRMHQDGGNDIAFGDYPGGYTLFAFDLTADLSDQCHFEPVREGNLRLEVHFNKALPSTINVITYAEFDNVIEIDRSRNVLFDYTS